VAALRRIVHAIDTYSRRLLLECQVTAPQLVCLHALAEEGPLTSRLLADRVHLNPSTLVGIVDRLEAKGFVERSRDQPDRRAVSLRMTEQGFAFVRQAPSPLQAALTDRLKGLDETKQSHLAEALEEVVRLMEADEFAPTPIMALPRYNHGRQAG
jgi:DNA-binding MarR family transcriptional regulator